MIPIENIKNINLSKLVRFKGAQLEIDVPEKLRKCQNVCGRAILENMMLRQIILEKCRDEKEYQQEILNLDNLINNTLNTKKENK